MCVPWDVLQPSQENNNGAPPYSPAAQMGLEPRLTSSQQTACILGPVGLQGTDIWNPSNPEYFTGTGQFWTERHPKKQKGQDF